MSSITSCFKMMSVMEGKMVKLNNKEIENLIALESGDINMNIPRNSHSMFRFEIKENIKDLIDNIKSGNKAKKRNLSYIGHDGSYNEYLNYEKRWNLEKKDGSLLLIDTEWNNCYATVTPTSKGLHIETATGHYQYNITQNKQGGCTVEFNGPVNGLLNQQLLPDMTYIHHTLEGKFIDKEGNDITSYAPISIYGELRKQKNQQPNKFDEINNPQDGFGFNINRHFNNEITFLPLSKTNQELQMEIATKRFKNQKSQKEGAAYGFRDKKEKIMERIKNRTKDNTTSGVVMADKIAEDIISGKEKRIITPEVAKEIIQAKLQKG